MINKALIAEIWAPHHVEQEAAGPLDGGVRIYRSMWWMGAAWCGRAMRIIND